MNVGWDVVQTHPLDVGRIRQRSDEPWRPLTVDDLTKCNIPDFGPPRLVGGEGHRWSIGSGDQAIEMVEVTPSFDVRIVLSELDRYLPKPKMRARAGRTAKHPWARISATSPAGSGQMGRWRPIRRWRTLPRSSVRIAAGQSLMIGSCARRAAT